MAAVTICSDFGAPKNKNRSIIFNLGNTKQKQVEKSKHDASNKIQECGEKKQ